MSSPSFPIETTSQLVIDASVVINFNGTFCAPEIIRALPGTFVVTENAFHEIKNGTNNGHDDANRLQALIQNGDVRLVKIPDAGFSIYENLVEGTAIRTLDDGEAATLAYAAATQSIAVIDERKARSIGFNDFPEMKIASTIDLLSHGSIEQILGREQQIQSIINALKNARMRVPTEQLERVIALIGPEQASNCHSLPRAIRSA